jgi:DNA gyrase/topoisomerase IV subunit A
MKLREGDHLGATACLQGAMIFITHSGSALMVAEKEIPVRDSAAVGVALMGVRENDKIVACCGVSSTRVKTDISVALTSGKTKAVSTKDITKGHRGLKGTKISGRDSVVTAYVADNL